MRKVRMHPYFADVNADMNADMNVVMCLSMAPSKVLGLSFGAIANSGGE